MSAARAWETVIGLEIHVQLATQSKLFCGSSVAYGSEPNTHIDPVTLGMPGVLPVINREAVELAMRIGLALGCTINRRSEFSRKHYFYPDLPKGYQITQYDQPLCSGGVVRAVVDDAPMSWRLNRIHMEEDAGKTVHDAAGGVSRVDFNRAGVALVEMVSEPELSSPAEAVAYMKAVHQVVTAVGASNGDMEKGNFRCDANISVRPVGREALGTRVEIKNVNSFRFVGKAIAYEVERQIAALESGGEVVQETRLWDEEGSRTRTMRTKEEAHDYRYFNEPDLMTLVVDDAWVERVRAGLPELPEARAERFVRDYGLEAYDAGVLTDSGARADYFEAVCAAAPGQAQSAANWITGDLLGSLNREERELEDNPVAAPALGRMIALIAAGTISGKMGKQLFRAMYEEGADPDAWVKQHGGQISDEGAIAEIVVGVLDGNPGQVAGYLGGKGKLLGFFVGQVMKATRGKANPQMVNEVVRRLLEERR